MCCPICGKKSYDGKKSGVTTKVSVNGDLFSFNKKITAPKLSSNLCIAHYKDFEDWASKKDIPIEVLMNGKLPKRITDKIKTLLSIEDRFDSIENKKLLLCKGSKYTCQECKCTSRCGRFQEMHDKYFSLMLTLERKLENFFIGSINFSQIKIDESYFSEWISVKLKSLIKLAEDGEILEYCQHEDCGYLAKIKTNKGSFYCNLHYKYYTPSANKKEFQESLVIKHAKLIVEEIKSLT